MNLNLLDNQVGGHAGVLAMGEDNEIVVKPSLPQELEFYEQGVHHPELQAWMPSYYGTLTLTRQPPPQQDQEGSSPQQKQLQQPTQDQSGSSQQAEARTKFLGSIISPPLYQAQEHKSSTNVSGQDAKGKGEDVCICLENLSHGFYKPCILDLKLGVQLYDEQASEEKKARLGADSANTTSGTLGIRLTGFRVYDSEADEFIIYSKHYGRDLTADTILDGFRTYFAAKLGSRRMHLVIERFVQDLTDFLAIIETQELRMRSSSLLMVYEGDPGAFDQALLLEQEKIAAEATRAKKDRERASGHNGQNKRMENGGNEHVENEDSDEEEEDDGDGYTQKISDMRLIDFGHSVWTPGQGADEGVVLGVKSALSHFNKLLEQDYPEEDE